MSDIGTNFVSENSDTSSNQFNVEHVVSSAYHHQSNGQVEACINFVSKHSKSALSQAGTKT